MEPIVAVRMSAPVASFRRPFDHNYQRTLPMPPPTALLGIAGSALGFSDREIWASDSPLRRLKVSVWAEEEPGRARDMWTVLKIKNKKIAERSPYFRELLFFARYTLLYGGEEEMLRRLETAFRDPTYPLSLGREDELALVEEVVFDTAVEGIPRFQGTAVPVDIRQLPKLKPILREGAVFEPPAVEMLPLAFTVNADNGVRHPAPLVPFTFLPLGIETEIADLRALQFEERNFVWLNT